MPAPHQTSKLPWQQYAFFACGHVLNDLSTAVFYTYLVVYFWNVQGLSPAMAGNLILVGQLADAVSTPLWGLESDRAGELFPACGRYGRRKSWHLFGAITVAATLPFMFGECPGGCETAAEWAKAIFYAPIIVMTQLGWAATQVAHMSLIPELTPDENERVLLNSVRYAAQVFANVLAYGTFFALLGEDEGTTIGPGDAPKFWNLALICVGVGAAFAIVFQIGVKEPKWTPARNGTGAEKKSVVNSASVAIAPHHGISVGSVDGAASPADAATGIRKWHHWFRHPEFFVVSLIYVGSQVIFNSGQTYLPLYLTHTLLLEKKFIAILPIVVFAAGFVASALVGVLTKLVGRYGVALVGVALVIGGCGWMYDLSIGMSIFGAGVLMGAGQSIIIIATMGFVSDMIGTDTSTAGFVYSFVSFMDKFTGGAVIVAIQHLQPSEPPSPGDPMLFFRDVLSFVATGIAAATGIMVCVLWSMKAARKERRETSRRRITFDDSILSESPSLNLTRAEAPPATILENKTENLRSGKEHRGSHSTITASRGGRTFSSSMAALSSSLSSPLTSSFVASIESTAGVSPKAAPILARALWRERRERERVEGGGGREGREERF